MKRLPCILCAALLTLPIGSVQAADDATQVPSKSGYTGQSLPFGKQVRITLVTPGHVGASWQAGTLVYSAADSVVLRRALSGNSDVRVAVPLASTDRMQVRTGSTGHSFTGFIIGGSLGLLSGALAGVALNNLDLGFSSDSEPSTSNVAAAIGGAMVGGFVLGSFGALIGALIRTDHWEDVPLDPLQVGMISGPNAGPALGLSLRFRVDP